MEYIWHTGSLSIFYIISLSAAKAQSEFRGRAKQAPLLVYACINIHNMLLALLFIERGPWNQFVCH